jgi:hypothetical protein
MSVQAAADVAKRGIFNAVEPDQLRGPRMKGHAGRQNNQGESENLTSIVAAESSVPLTEFGLSEPSQQPSQRHTSRHAKRRDGSCRELRIRAGELPAI